MTDHSTLTELTADIVAAFVSANQVEASDLASLIGSTYQALSSLGQEAPEAEPAQEKASAAQIRKSIRPDGLISFEDGKSYKTLKRHLSTKGLTMESYRAKWGLPTDYPSVAPNYSATRSAMAKSLGLGQLGRQSAKAKAAKTVRKPKAKAS